MQTKSDSQNDVEVIDPDIGIEIGGEEITIREFNFFQGLKLSTAAKPLIDELAERLDADEELSLDLIADLFAHHSDLVVQLIAASTGKKVAWVSELNDSDGQVLLMNFWQVNKGFFVNRLLIRKMAAVKPASSPLVSPESLAS